MPKGIPVATVALNASKNAGILAATIIGTFDDKVSEKITAYKKSLESEVVEKISKLKKDGWENNFD
jgi:5-(carboxyamino)imidazole ribonucleotide mutase